MSLNLYLKELSNKIKAESNVIRTTFNNGTNKGNGFETVIRNLISTYIPSTFNVTQGEIIDTFGNHSGQVDLLIVQDFHLKGYTDGRPNLIFYDLLTGVGEMKTSLTTKELKSTVINSNKLSEFKRHPENNNMLSGEFYEDKKDKAPPFFLIALTSNVAIKTLESQIKGTLISMIIILNHPKTNNGLVVIGDTHKNTDVINAMNKFGEQIVPNVWQSDNPIIALIWGLNRFHVPFMNLTNMTTEYFK